EPIGQVDDRTAPGSDIAAGHLFRRGPVGVARVGDAAGGALDPPRLERADAEHLTRGPVVRDVDGDGRHGQVRVAAEVVVGQDDLPQVLAVGGGEPVAEGVGGQAVLAAARGRLQAAGDVRVEADAA